MNPVLGFGTIHASRSSALLITPPTGTSEVDSVSGIVVLSAATGSGSIKAAASGEII